MAPLRRISIAIGVLLIAHTAAAQYALQRLVPPDGFDPLPNIYVFHINAGGQVLGSVHPTRSNNYQPVLWTNGVPQVLTVPDGYVWADYAAYPQLNDNGTVVARVLAVNPPSGLPYQALIAYWQSGSTVGQLMPPPPTTAAGCGALHGFADLYPHGLNSSGHVLLNAVDLTSGECYAFYIWAGPDDPMTFTQLPVPESPQLNLLGYPCPAFLPSVENYSQTDNHLNDADHVSLGMSSRPPVGQPGSPSCYNDVAVVLAGPGYGTSINPPAPLGHGDSTIGAHALNNHDQALLTTDAGTTTDDLLFWDGTTYVDLGGVDDGFLNERGEVLFDVPNGNSAIGQLVKPRIYTSGALADVPLPPAIPGCSFHPSIGNAFARPWALGSNGEIVLDFFANCEGYGGPDYSQYEDVSVLLTPATPTLSWPAPGDIASGTALGSAQLDATATDPVTGNPVAGTFVYTPPAGTVLSVGANQSLSVQFTPSGLGYKTATATTTINVVPALTVAVSAPNGGEKLFAGTPYVIQWTAANGVGGPQSFDVLISTNGGSTFTPIAACASLPGSARSCTWSAPGPKTTAGRIKVVGHDHAANSVGDVSDANFTIASGSGTITVTAPNTALSWAVGSTQTIKWTHNLGLKAQFSVDVSRDNGGTWTTIAPTVGAATATTGTLAWTVTGPTTTTALVRVTWLSGSVTDKSNVAFTIANASITLTAPNTAVNWAIGSHQKITWTHNQGAAALFTISESTDGGGTFPILIAQHVPASTATAGAFTWVVAAPAATRARIQVTAEASGAMDVNNVNFTVAAPFVTVKKPSAGQTVTEGTTLTVTWSNNLGSLEDVTIELSYDGGTTYSVVLAASTASKAPTGSAAVTIPGGTTSTTARVRVSWVVQPTVNSQSALFTIN
jgi:hypothetical protein